MVLERVCLRLLNAAHASALVEFFEEHIQEIMANIEATRNGRVRSEIFHLDVSALLGVDTVSWMM